MSSGALSCRCLVVRGVAGQLLVAIQLVELVLLLLHRIWCAPRTSMGGLVLHKVRSKGWCVTPL